MRWTVLTCFSQVWEVKFVVSIAHSLEFWLPKIKHSFCSKSYVASFKELRTSNWWKSELLEVTMSLNIIYLLTFGWQDNVNMCICIYIINSRENYFLSSYFPLLQFVAKKIRIHRQHFAWRLSTGLARDLQSSALVLMVQRVPGYRLASLTPLITKPSQQGESGWRNVASAFCASLSPEAASIFSTMFTLPWL